MFPLDRVSDEKKISSQRHIELNFKNKPEIRNENMYEKSENISQYSLENLEFSINISNQMN